MRKLLFALLLALMLPIGGIADVDLSGMSYEELVALRDQLNLAIWNSAEWQQVTVPQGLWEVDKDIPSGHWTICPVPESSVSIYYGNALKENGMEVSFLSDNIYTVYLDAPGSGGYMPGFSTEQSDICLESGSFVEISGGYAIFSPYHSKPDLGFSGFSPKPQPAKDVALESGSSSKSASVEVYSEETKAAMRELVSIGASIRTYSGITTGSVNLREEPNANSKKLDTIPAGTELVVLNPYYTEKWHRVMYDWQMGYISVNYIDVYDYED